MSLLDDHQRTLLAALPTDQPVRMLNLLRYCERVEPGDGGPAISGREAYGVYARVAMQVLAAVGAEVVLGGRATPALIGPAGEAWDEVFVVRYPSPAAFSRMLELPEYRAAVPWRALALADSRLIPLLAMG